VLKPTTLNFYGQELPATTYKWHGIKVNNKDIESKINELLNEDGISNISFWKYPVRRNRCIDVTSYKGEMKNSNWKELL
jgi:hypothetical protein